MAGTADHGEGALPGRRDVPADPRLPRPADDTESIHLASDRDDRLQDDLQDEFDDDLDDDLEDELDDELDDAGRGRESVPFDTGEGDIATRVANARARHGRGGGMLAAGMLGLDAAVSGRKVREQAPVVVASNSDPVDIDTDGIRVELDGVDVVAPPMPRTAPIAQGAPGKRRRWR